MSESDTSFGSVDAQGESDRQGGASQSESSGGGRVRSLLSRGLKRGVSSGALASLGGGALAFRGVRRFREGARLRGVLQTSVGGVLVGLGVAQGRKTMRGSGGSGTGGGVDQTDVVDTSPDIGDVASTSESGSSGGGSASTDRVGSEASSVVDTSPNVEDAATEPGDRSTEHAGGEEASEVVDTGPDVEDAASTGDDAASTEDDAASTGDDETESETERGGDADLAAGTEGSEGEATGDGDSGAAGADLQSFDSLGEAAFDEDSSSLPAPQRAFNQEFLALGAEAVWGIRDFDGVVVVSQDYDSIEDRTDLRHVTTSEIEDDRTVHVPDSVLDHWEDLLDGGTAVESGDDLVFATSDDFESDDLLVVVPAKWTTDLLGDEE